MITNSSESINYSLYNNINICRGGWKVESEVKDKVWESVGVWIGMAG